MKQMEVFLTIAIFLLITAIILIFNTMQRDREFISHTHNIQKSAVHGAAFAIDQQIEDKQRHVRLFADEYQVLINRLIQFPNDEQTANDIKTRLEQRFTDFFTFTITDHNGVPVLSDIDSLVGEACQLDLSRFAKRAISRNKPVKNKIFIHPQPYHYHYDVMVPLLNNQAVPRIFFVSFYPKDLSNILKTHEIPGQSLMMVKQSDLDLIEVTSEGSREQLKREIRLSPEERQRIVAFEDIGNTQWRLVNLPESGYVDNYRKGLWKEALFIMLVVSAALILPLLVLNKFTHRRYDNEL